MSEGEQIQRQAGQSHWVYAIGPLAGALLAVGFAFILRGRGGDHQSAAAAQGTLGQERPPAAR
jgi:aquaporin Z